MAKGVSDTYIVTPLAALRELIRNLETQTLAPKRDRQGTLALLHLRSRVEAEIQASEASGRDVRAERTRLETLDNMLSSQAKAIVRTASAAGLRETRETADYPQEHGWWWLDERVSQTRRQRWTKTGLLAGGITVLLVVLGLVFNTFFGMSADEKQAYQYSNVADQHVTDGEYAQAIAEYELALQLDSSLSQAQVTLGVLYEQEGRLPEAERALETAQEALGSAALYEQQVAQAYQKMGQLDQAVAHADLAVSLEPDSAQAYLIRGGIHESLGNRGEALADLERASTLAQEQGQDELYVLAKMRFGMLLQQAPADSFGPSAS